MALVHTALLVWGLYCYRSEGFRYALHSWYWFGTTVVVKGAGKHCTGGAGLVLLL
jgi:hypothetical protein